MAIRDGDSNRRDKGYGKFLDEIGILEEAQHKWMKALQASTKNDVKAGENKRSSAKSLNTFEFSKAKALENMKHVTNMQPVSILNGTEFAKGPVDLLTQVTNFFDSLGNSVEHPAIGSVMLLREGVKSSIGHGVGRKKSIAFAALPDIIEKGVIIDAQRNWKGNSFDTVVIAAPIKIGANDEFYAGVVIRRDTHNGKQSYYLHELEVIKKNSMPSKTVATQTGRTHGGKTAPLMSLLQRLNDVNSLTEKDIVSHEGKFSLKDTDGRELSAGQQQFFKDSKVRDANGNLKVMYHGTGEAGFTVFESKYSDDGRSFFFTDNINVAKSYSASDDIFSRKHFETIQSLEKHIAQEMDENVEIRKNGKMFELWQDNDFVMRDETLDDLYWDYNEYMGFGGDSANYKVYLNLENPLVIDADGNNWDEIPVPWSDDLMTTRSIAEYAGENGYDGVMIKNVIDTGLYGSRFETSDIAIAFNSNQIKSVENKEPTKDPDIRFSLKDSEGNKLSKTQQEYFAESKIRDEDGNLRVVYHGSAENFTVFDRTKGRSNMDIQGMFFSPWEVDAMGYGENVQAYYLNIKNPAPESLGYKALRKFQGQNNAGVKARDYLESLGYDGVNNSDEEYIAFHSNQIKSVDNLNPTENDDIRYSMKDDINITEAGTVSKYSLKSWDETDKNKLLKALTKAGYFKEDVEKWMNDVNSIAAIIAADRDRLDYTPDEYQQMLRNNDEYYKTLDASTLCKKRLLYQGTYNAIQHRLPNTPLLPEDVIRIRQIMDEAGYEVPCGICYEESRKKHEGKFAERWLSEYTGDYIPTLDEVTTTDGRVKLRREHPEVLESYLTYQRTRGSANPKVSMTRTDYRGDILNLHPTTIKNIKHIGGLRIQSFSDFETPHLIDMMQAIMDMSAKKLTSQAYTKVPAFARVFGGTGVKINLSLIGQVDETGNLVFDDKEGMPHQEAFEIREMYPENVGTILVGANEESILAAWADDRIDMVIPFHRSGWSFDEMERLGLGGYEDFTEYQSEKYLDDERGPISFKAYKEIYGKKMEGLYSDDYWDFSKTGKENAEAYLKLCAEQKRVPVFSNFLVDNGDGSWSLKPDGSTDGYWKSLIDFKMYDNDGVGVPQKLVQPNFNMEEARKILDEYNEDANDLPVAYDIVERFVAEYKTNNQRSKYQLKDTDSYAERKVAKLEDKVAKLRSEFKRTYLKTPKDADVNRQATRLIKKYDSNLTLHTKLVNAMRDIFKIYKTENANWDEAYDIAEDIARQIVDKISILHDESWQEYKDLRTHLKNVPVRVSEADRASMTDYSAFRKANFRRIKLTNDQGLSVNQYYQALVEQWPDKFTDDYVTASDQLYHIADVLDSLAPWYETYDSAEMQDFVTDIAADIMETAYNLQTRKTFADRKAEEKAAAVARTKAQRDAAMDKLQEQYEEKLIRQKKVSGEKMDAAVARVKAQRDAAMEKLQTRYEEKLIRQKKVSREKMDVYKEKQKDRASRKKAMERLQKSYKWLNERLLNPSDTKHIPESYRKVIAELLSGFDFETDRSAAYAEKNGPSKKTIQFMKFMNDYSEIMKSEEGQLIEFDPDIIDTMNEIKNAVDGKRLADLDTETLDKVSRLLKTIQHQMSYVNRCFSEDISKTISELGEDTINGTRAMKKSKEYAGMRKHIDDLLNQLNVTPSDMFELIGGPMKTLYQQLRKGMDRHIINLKVAKDYVDKVVDSKKMDEWSNEVHKIQTSDGALEITTSQIMSLYALMQRKQAQGHILGSGIVMAPVEVKTGKGLKSRSTRKMEETKIIPELEDVMKIISRLTDEQIEVADQLRSFLGNECSEWGNRTSMKLYGYKKFTEKDYFPIKSSNYFLNENFDTKNVESSLKNMGFTKAIVKEASNPIIIDDIFDVFTNHVSKMSMYEALVPAMTDFQRVYNYKSKNAEGKQNNSMQKALSQAFGRKTTDYIKRFMEDINGQAAKNDSAIATSLMALYKKASIGGNIRVLLQQPTAIVRAMAVMNPKYLLSVKPATKADVAEMQAHCPIAQWKSWGFYNTDVSRSFRDIMFGKKNLIDNVFMGSYGKADDFTWACIWKAVKKEVADNNPDLEKGSDEYWQKVNERASYVFDRTQVVDSVFHRSQIMRNKGTFEKMVTAFMTEPTKTYNMMRTEIILAQREKASGQRTAAAERMGRVLSVYMLNALAVSMAAAIADAMRGAGGSDDEDKGNFLQRWWAHTKANFVDNANPLNLVPYVKDVVSLYSGYDVARMDTQAFSKLLQVNSMWEGIANGTSKYSTAHVMRKTAEAVSYFTGLPVRNVLRDAEGIVKGVAGAFGGGTEMRYLSAKMMYTLGPDSGNRSIFADLYYDALAEGNSELANEIRSYMISKGVESDYIKRRKKTWDKNHQS